jgi:DNA polymerase
MQTKLLERQEAISKLTKKLLAIRGALADERRKNKVNPVVGEGSLAADIMFVGEAPGKNESIKGKPFCGASGKFLDIMLGSIGLLRSDIYITNLVNDRPTDNRDPSSQEIELYSPFLEKQMEIIKPKVIATLGRIPMAYIMKRFGLEEELDVISKIHGKTFKVKAPWGKNIKIIPLYHPASALYNGSNRATLLEDFKVLKAVI